MCWQLRAAHWVLLVPPRKPPNLPDWCFYEGQQCYLPTSAMHPNDELEAPAPWIQSKEPSCTFKFLLPSISAQESHHKGLWLELRDKGTSNINPEGAKLRLLNLHSVGLFKPPNLLDLVHQVPTVDIFHHEVQAVLQEKHPTQSAGSLQRTKAPGSKDQGTWQGSLLHGKHPWNPKTSHKHEDIPGLAQALDHRRKDTKAGALPELQLGSVLE